MKAREERKNERGSGEGDAIEAGRDWIYISILKEKRLL